MNISKFKLSNGGFTGIEVQAVESISQGNLTILDKVKRERTYPLSLELRDKIQDLKYFFLNLSGHWIDPYNAWFDMTTYKPIFPEEGAEPKKSFLILQNLLNHTAVTGVSLKSAGFSIQGTIETVDGKKMGISTPTVIEEDDVSFFIEAMDKINVIMDDIAMLLKSPVAVPITSAEKVLEITGVNTKDMNLTSAELVDLVYQKFESMGAIVLVNDNEQQTAITGGDKIEDGKTTVYEKSGNIDSDNIPVSEDHVDELLKEEEEELTEDQKEEEMRFGYHKTPYQEEVSGEDDETIPDEFIEIHKTPKVKKTKGTLASEKNFPDLSGEKPVMKVVKETEPEGADLTDYEYSSNLGLPVDGAGLEGDDGAPSENSPDSW